MIPYPLRQQLNNQLSGVKEALKPWVQSMRDFKILVQLLQVWKIQAITVPSLQ